MIGLFNSSSNSKASTRPILPSIDESLYPLRWPAEDKADGGVVFESPQALLTAILAGEQLLNQQDFWQILHANKVYQEWVNFTVFGRYVQRSFAAFYRQSEDNFNSGMPELLRHELMRHAQYLPESQTLFFGGKLPLEARQDKLFNTTLNPCTALACANKPSHSPTKHQAIINQVFVNQVTVKSPRVTAFAVRHSKRTSERLRSEVMVLDFADLRLVNEQEIVASNSALSHIEDRLIVLRNYELR
ncbi:hypothetical protein [Psychrobacter pygoscelis]|uniref:hypothetical protein n=1 Tax=Psychrobacter pygoscelis TaxID=2488563 RepID=UPI001038EBE8|nr:hypothetical protein [Psychrobacter pygoscelis]